MKKYSLSLLIAMIAVLGNVYSQGNLFFTGQNGFHLSGQITSSKESTLIGVAPAYSMNGKFTFGLGIGFEDSKYYDLSSTAISPFIGFLALQQGVKGSPINLSLGGKYQYNIFSDVDDFSINTIGLNVSLSHIIESSTNLKIAPIVGLGWSRSTAILYYSPGFKDSTSISGVGFGFGLSFIINQMFITPVVNFSDGESQFTLLIGYTFPQ